MNHHWLVGYQNHQMLGFSTKISARNSFELPSLRACEEIVAEGCGKFTAGFSRRTATRPSRRICQKKMVSLYGWLWLDSIENTRRINLYKWYMSISYKLFHFFISIEFVGPVHFFILYPYDPWFFEHIFLPSPPWPPSPPSPATCVLLRKVRGLQHTFEVRQLRFILGQYLGGQQGDPKRGDHGKADEIWENHGKSQVDLHVLLWETCGEMDGNWDLGHEYQLEATGNWDGHDFNRFFGAWHPWDHPMYPIARYDTISLGAFSHVAFHSLIKL